MRLAVLMPRVREKFVMMYQANFMYESKNLTGDNFIKFVDDIYPYHRDEFIQLIKEEILINGYSAVKYGDTYHTLDHLNHYMHCNLNLYTLAHMHRCCDCVLNNGYCPRDKQVKNKGYCISDKKDIINTLDVYDEYMFIKSYLNCKQRVNKILNDFKLYYNTQLWIIRMFFFHIKWKIKRKIREIRGSR